MLDYYTVKQIAEMLGYTRRGVQKMIKRGVFPGAVKLPGGRSAAYLIPRDEVEAELERRRSSPKREEG